jgi:hypothetical protein
VRQVDITAVDQLDTLNSPNATSGASKANAQPTSVVCGGSTRTAELRLEVTSDALLATDIRRRLDDQQSAPDDVKRQPPSWPRAAPKSASIGYVQTIK